MMPDTRTAQLVEISEGKEYTYTLDPPFDDVTRVRVCLERAGTRIYNDGSGQRIICYDRPLGGMPPDIPDVLMAWGGYAETPLSVIQRSFGKIAAEMPADMPHGIYRALWPTFSEETRIVLANHHTTGRAHEQRLLDKIKGLEEQLATKLTRGIDAAAIAERVREMIEHMVDAGAGGVDEDEEGDYDDA